MGGHLVILSGGLDSTVCLALAAEQARGLEGPGAQDGAAQPQSTPLVAVTFDYGQRHRVEIARAQLVARHYGASHVIVALDTAAWGGSALTDLAIPVPHAGGATVRDPGIPVTYVPARNTIFLAVALGIAEARGLDAVWIGVNAVDYSGYPDCRPEFVEAMRQVARTGQRRGVEGDPIAIETPLIAASKADIVRLASAHGAPLHLTWSCYEGGAAPCGTCDACVLRHRGFTEAGVPDPAPAAGGPT